MLYVTTSWDDGDVLDMRVAEILSRYKAKGTFYIAQKYRKQRLSEEQLVELSYTHEIGAHTLNHPDLTTISREQKYVEIKGSKDWLEKIIGKEVPLFCYPFGRYDTEAIAVVKEAGFHGARTTAHSHTELPASTYEMPTTLHVYPFPFRKKASGGYYWRVLLEPLMQRYSSYRALGVPWWRMYSWQSAARAAFDHAYKHGKVFHVWGHSWELEQYTMWKELESFLAYSASYKNVTFVTNSELLNKAQHTS